MWHILAAIDLASLPCFTLQSAILVEDSLTITGSKIQRKLSAPRGPGLFSQLAILSTLLTNAMKPGDADNKLRDSLSCLLDSSRMEEYYICEPECVRSYKANFRT